MCEERDFELPESFISKMKSGALTVESTALIKDLAEQTGFSVEAVTAALTEEGIAAFRSSGILF